MTDRVNLSEPVRTICEALGLEHGNVARLEIEPGTLTASVFRTNEDGSKYFENEQAPQDTLEFKIQT